jgi:hypothetical protein
MYQKWDEQKAQQIHQLAFDWLNEDDKNVFWRNFLYSQGYRKSQLDFLKQKYPIVKEIIADLDSIQEERIIQQSFEKKASERMATFLLSSKFGYRETTNSNHSIDLGNFNIKDVVSFDE